MTDTMLAFIVEDVFMKRLKNTAPAENTAAYKLCSECFSIPLDELLSFPQGLNESYTVALNALKLAMAYKNKELSLSRLEDLLRTYEYLLNTEVQYSESFTSTFLDILASVVMEIKTEHDIRMILSVANYIKDKKNVDVTSVYDALYPSLISYVLTEHEKLQSNISDFVGVKNLIRFVIDAKNMGADAEFSTDRALDLAIEFIETDIDFLGMLERGENTTTKDVTNSRELLGLCKYLTPVGEYAQDMMRRLKDIIGESVVSLSNFNSSSVLIPSTEQNPNLRYIKSGLSIYSFAHTTFHIDITRASLLDGTKVVVKTYSKINDRWDKSKFDAEIEICRQISERSRPDNVFLKCYDAQIYENSVEIVMESCDTDLAQKVIELKDRGQRFTLANLVKIAYMLISGFAELASNGVFHQDIKPQNILWKNLPEKNDFVVKITDFSVSVFKADQATTSKRVVMGTSAFMAPEIKGLKETDYNPIKSDVYSLGLTLLHLYTFEDLTDCRNFEPMLITVEPSWLQSMLRNMLSLTAKDRKDFKGLLTYFQNLTTVTN